MLRVAIVEDSPDDQTRLSGYFLKHFALNDQELNRNNQLCVWADEQAIREGYLKAFEYSVKEGRATAIMAAFNYIGHQWAGASPALLKTVLQDEWGFHGFILPDAAMEGYNYINGDQAVRNGITGILKLDFMGDAYIKDTTSATSVLAMREAIHGTLYAVANSNVYAHTSDTAGGLAWDTIFYICLAAVIVLLAVVEVITIKRYRKRVNMK